ncbi:MAG: M20/M25/M40 family metallo-hydrolase [Chitinophagaceae bacterium]|nr:M20/M25/M40 family metallo-hydrolase [Chitinophagaceae bacterium]
MTNSFLRVAVVFILAAGMTGCGQSGGSSAADSDEGLSALNKDSLAAHIQILASDSFQGRRPFTSGETRTVDYLSRAFAALGLEPGNGAAYTQDVPMVEISPAGTPVMKVQSAKGSFDLKSMNDFVIWTERPDSSITIDKTDVVFAGFGIVAPEYNWNDYAGLDVKGKTVVVMVNDPGYYDSTLFKGHTMTYYGRWTYKYEEAARQGAAACLIIHNTGAASYPFQVVKSSNGGVKLHLDTRGNGQYQLALQGWITEETGKKLLTTAGKDSSLLTAAKQKGFKPRPLDIKLTAALKVHEVYNKSHNVIAKITGSRRPDEYIIYSAHWDHLGIGQPDGKGDSIYNGAADNASGTAALLEIARAFKNIPEKPERTVIFLAVTAEEQGLLGSAYYAQHPIYPLGRTVANLNIDVLNTYGPTKDITYSGKGQSELEDLLTDEAKAKGRYVAPEDHPEAGHYFRSDHFNFARAGVPSLTADGGIDDVSKGKEYGKQKHDEYTAQHYHQPSDEYDAKTWDLSGGLQDIGLVYLIGKKLAFNNSWPQWKAGSEFKAIRDQSAQERK